MQKVKIILHGYLKELYPKDLSLSGCNVSEIINGMCKVTKAFNPRPGVEKHTINILGYKTKESLFEPLSSNVKELHLVPAMCGGKGGGFAKIAIGVVFIAAAFLMPASIGALTIIGNTTVASFAFSFGLSLVLGGLLEFLSPAPRKDLGAGKNDPEASKYLGSSGNTVKIGTRIPLLFGEHIAGGHYLSYDVDAVDVTATQPVMPDTIYAVKQLLKLS